MTPYLLAVIGPVTLGPLAGPVLAVAFGLCLLGAVYFGVGLLRGKK